MNEIKIKCKAGKKNGCLTCRYMFYPLEDVYCSRCQIGRNCPLLLSISYDKDRPACDGCHWEGTRCVKSKQADA